MVVHYSKDRKGVFTGCKRHFEEAPGIGFAWSSTDSDPPLDALVPALDLSHEALLAIRVGWLILVAD
jgi:hypothetical protein